MITTRDMITFAAVAFLVLTAAAIVAGMIQSTKPGVGLSWRGAFIAWLIFNAIGIYTVVVAWLTHRWLR